MIGKQEMGQKTWQGIWTLGTLSGVDFRKEAISWIRMKTLTPLGQRLGLRLSIPISLLACDTRVPCGSIPFNFPGCKLPNEMPVTRLQNWTYI